MKTAGLLLLMLSARIEVEAAQVIDVDRLAQAIYHAEGGAKTKHPYGIKSVRPRNKAHARQICLRTIKRAHSEWDGSGDFIEFLGLRYAPLHASNDPAGLNRNWVRNVRNRYQSK